MIAPLHTLSPSDDEGSRQRQSLSAPQQRDLYLEDLVTYGWPSIGRGIVLAGGMYPTVVAAIYVVVGLVLTVVGSFSALRRPTDLAMVGAFFLGSLAFAAIFGVIGLIWSGIVCAVTLPVVHAVVWSMKLRPNLIWLGAFSGGLVAFVAIIPGAVQIPRWFSGGQGWQISVMLLMGPALSTVVGQIGGARGGARAIERIAADRLAPKIELLRMKFGMGLSTPDQITVAATETDSVQTTQRFQFRTIHLLWVGVWVSLLLTMIRLSGIPYALIIPLLMGWCVFQALTLMAGRLFARRFGPWWKGWS
jgi:hypothetical protein